MVMVVRSLLSWWSQCCAWHPCQRRARRTMRALIIRWGLVLILCFCLELTAFLHRRWYGECLPGRCGYGTSVFWCVITSAPALDGIWRSLRDSRYSYNHPWWLYVTLLVTRLYQGSCLSQVQIWYLLLLMCSTIGVAAPVEIANCWGSLPTEEGGRSAVAAIPCCCWYCWVTLLLLLGTVSILCSFPVPCCITAYSLRKRTVQELLK